MKSFAYQQEPGCSNIKKFIVQERQGEWVYGRVSTKTFQDWEKGGGGGGGSCLCKVQFLRINNNNEQFITA